MKKRIRVALAGATGLVGREIVRVLEESEVIDAVPVFLASKDSEGEEVPYKGLEATVMPLDGYDFKGVDVAIFAVPAAVAAKYVPVARDAGVMVLDASGRQDKDTQVGALGSDLKKARVVACPHPAALALASALSAIQAQAKIQRVVTTVMQPTSGAGKLAMDELYRQSVSLLGGAGAGAVDNEHFPMQVAFNILPQVGEFEKNGQTTAENRIARDFQSLMGAAVPVSVSCVYVPTFVGVSQSVNITLDKPLAADEVRNMLEASDTLVVIDDPESGEYSTPFGAAEMGAVYVSRVRADASTPNSLNLWIVADNLRAGVAENMVRMVEQVAVGTAA
ncbi:MAG: aspartate-semialdehyde dehydrogenase [Proteobacteria bacterium]|nr:aspartate-semialdehyde dehydrogenase [Pseudomonadota bacterium]